MSDQNAAVIERIRKLMALAERNPNQHEAEAAANKVQELLTEYGISMLTIERQTGAKKQARSDTRSQGGLYKWQRQLWENVAKLNYCMYWSHKGLEKGAKYEHQLLGSEVNVVSTRVMAEYLQQTIERLARERVGNQGALFFTKENIEYREGIAITIASRLSNLRYQREAEARRKKAEAGNTSNALTILDVMDAEHDANMDHLYGEGYSARVRAQRAKWNADYLAAQEAKKAWRAANPEAAAEEDRLEAKARAEWAKKDARRKPRAEKVRYVSNAYYEGMSDGHSISLDQQVDTRAPAKRIG